mmetsp:Transcript_3865/g.10245  ORF Transcript_3865/g.10245 Transcript_3865/m.10245 type:complete len:106 (+) Transcript_3865:558-875(+)
MNIMHNTHITNKSNTNSSSMIGQKRCKRETSVSSVDSGASRNDHPRRSRWHHSLWRHPLSSLVDSVFTILMGVMESPSSSFKRCTPLFTTTIAHRNNAANMNEVA